MLNYWKYSNQWLIPTKLSVKLPGLYIDMQNDKKTILILDRSVTVFKLLIRRKKVGSEKSSAFTKDAKVNFF